MNAAQPKKKYETFVPFFLRKISIRTMGSAIQSSDAANSAAIFEPGTMGSFSIRLFSFLLAAVPAYAFIIVTQLFIEF